MCLRGSRFKEESEGVAEECDGGEFREVEEIRRLIVVLDLSSSGEM